MGVLALAMPGSLAVREMSTGWAGADDHTSQRDDEESRLGEGAEGTRPGEAGSEIDSRSEASDRADRPDAQPALFVSDDRGPARESTAAVVDELGTADIPEVALQAYLGAQAALAEADPGCGVRWSLLAAIGRVESNHGQFGGAELRADGYGTEPVRGIPLDGRVGVANILDTDDGALDGDPVFDRAVGPMQFIPSTWEAVAVDGNDDGLADPDNIFDAALGAAVYLCAGDADLRDRGQLVQAVLRYNHSQEYVQIVLSLAEQYESGRVTPLPTPDFVPTDLPGLDAPVPGPATAGPPPGFNERFASAYDVPPTRRGSSPSAGSPSPSDPGTSTRPRPPASSTTSSSTTTTSRPSTTSSTSTSSTTTSTTPSSTTTSTTAPSTTSTTPNTTTPSTTTSSVPSSSTTTTTTVPDEGCPPEEGTEDVTDERATTTSTSTTTSTTTTSTTEPTPGDPAGPPDESGGPAGPQESDGDGQTSGDESPSGAAALPEEQATEPERPSRRTRVRGRPGRPT